MSVKSKIRKILDPQIRRVLPNYVVFEQNRNDRSGALYKAWGHIISNNITGAYYEFGVYKGDSFSESLRIYNDYYNWIQSQKSSEEEWRKKIQWYTEHQFYAFDTFEGMPENDERHHVFLQGSFLGKLSDVKQRMNKLKHSERVKYFKGEFGKVHKKQEAEIDKLDKVAIANVDCDLYLSTRDVLEIIKDKLQQGTILLMDDWYQFNADNSSGQRKAVKEFLENNQHIHLEDYVIYSHIGKAFIVHLNN
jgi:hypothetical protein